MKRKITFSDENTAWRREPRKGELNYELKRIITEQCTKKRFKDAVKSIEIAVDRLARKFGVKEFECEYTRDSNLDSSGRRRSWITECVSIRAFRCRANGTTAIHRVGATSHPHFFGKEERFANLSAPRDIHIFDIIDDSYDWEHKTAKGVKGIRPSLAAKFKKLRAARKASKR